MQEHLPKLNIPLSDMKLASGKDGIKVFDPLRKKYVALTPEEYVRQQFVAWLINDRHFNPALMANEIGIKVNDTKKRCDTVLFRPDGSPLIIVEYKAPDIKITQTVFDQIVRYNMTLRARYLVVSNGINHYCCVMDYSGDTYHFIPEIPDYQNLSLPFGEN